MTRAAPRQRKHSQCPPRLRHTLNALVALRALCYGVGGAPKVTALTPETSAKTRFADTVFDLARNRVVAVRGHFGLCVVGLHECHPVRRELKPARA